MNEHAEQSTTTSEISPDRLAVLAKIAEYERLGKFDCDVEDDPPTRALRAGECDYIGKKLSSKITTYVANVVAKRYFDNLIKNGDLVIKDVRGIENYLSVADGGAVITCNHFNAFDNYAVYKAIEPHLGKKRLYKIIREGNYTSFPGLYGYFFRHCNTLPLASNHSVMKEMMTAVKELLSRGEKILIYPEQGMWWNYRKPRPLKAGAFHFAVSASVPVVPCFITMEDTDRIGGDGFPIQAYTVHFGAPVFPAAERSLRDNTQTMSAAVFEFMKATYEDFYKTELRYSNDEGAV